MPDFATNDEFKTAIDAALASAGASDSYAPRWLRASITAKPNTAPNRALPVAR